MSEAEGGPAPPEPRPPPPKQLKPWKPGQSGNPAGRPKIEPRVRRYARRYDRRMCRVLAELAMDAKVAPSERRRAAMDLIAVGSGRPALVQEIAGRDGAPVGPLVNVNLGMGVQNWSRAEQLAFLESIRPIEATAEPVLIEVQAEEPRGE